MLKWILTSVVTLFVCSNVYAGASITNEDIEVADTSIRNPLVLDLEAELVPAVSVDIPTAERKSGTYTRWSHFTEINLAKKGMFTSKPEGAVTDKDKAIISQLSEEGKSIVDKHDQFRIKHLSIAWEKMWDFYSGSEQTYIIPFYSRFMYYESNRLPNWAKTAAIDQGTHVLLGNLQIQVKENKDVSLNVLYYDESESALELEELGHWIDELITSEEEAEEYDSNRILKVVVPAIEIQLNEKIDLLIEDINSMEKVFNINSRPIESGHYRQM